MASSVARRKTVLAFDVGIKNMAYCLLRTGSGLAERSVKREDGEYEVLQLEKFAIGEWGTAQQRLVCSLGNKLNDIAFQRVPDAIVIENQVASSSTLKILQFALQAYFIARYSEVPVRFQDGECKLRMCDEQATLTHEKKKCDSKAKYRLNKKYAQEQARKDLAGTVWENKLHQLKADDLADAYLHAAFFARHRV